MEVGLITTLRKGLWSFQCCPGPRGLGLSCAVGTLRRALGGRQRQQLGLLDLCGVDLLEKGELVKFWRTGVTSELPLLLGRSW